MMSSFKPDRLAIGLISLFMLLLSMATAHAEPKLLECVMGTEVYSRGNLNPPSRWGTWRGNLRLSYVVDIEKGTAADGDNVKQYLLKKTEDEIEITHNNDRFPNETISSIKRSDLYITHVWLDILFTGTCEVKPFLGPPKKKL